MPHHMKASSSRSVQGGFRFSRKAHDPPCRAVPALPLPAIDQKKRVKRRRIGYSFRFSSSVTLFRS